MPWFDSCCQKDEPGEIGCLRLKNIIIYFCFLFTHLGFMVISCWIDCQEKGVSVQPDIISVLLSMFDLVCSPPSLQIPNVFVYIFLFPFFYRNDTFRWY